MDCYNEFRNILADLQSSNNDVRNEAEEKYKNIEPKLKFEILFNVLSNESEDFDARYFSCVLCRRLIESSFIHLKLREFDLIKSKLLELVLSSSETAPVKKIVEIVIEFGKRQFDDDDNFQWPALVSFVFDTCLNSQNDDLKCIGLQIFGAIPNIFGDSLVDHIDNLCKLFWSTMGDDEKNISVREASVKTYSTVLVYHAFDPLPQFVSIVPLMLKTIEDSIVANPDNDVTMKALVDIADQAISSLKSFVPSILQLCLNILQNTETVEVQKNLAIEAFVTLAENCTEVRKCTDTVHALVRELLKLLTKLEDIPDWSHKDNDVEQDDDESDPSVTAEIAMDRLACAMRGKRILQEITRTVPLMLKSEHWQERHGGLMAISSTAEGLSRVMENMLGAIIEEVSPLLLDSHPRVRYAACNTVGQMCTDFGLKLIKPYHEKMVPNLISILDDEENPRVQAYAGAALVNFLEPTPRAIAVHYLPHLAQKLYTILMSQLQQLATTKRRILIEQVITTVAALADSTDEAFLPFYDQYMDLLKNLLCSCNADKELRQLKGKTIECISLMGLAVGRDKFLQDGQDVMDLLLKSQTEIDANNNEEKSEVEGKDNSDDPSVQYMMSAWARICKLLGKEFAPFLPLVMKPLLKSVQVSTDMCVMSDEESDDVDQNKWEVVKVTDDKKFAINTSNLEDKAMACQMLVCYASELTDSFYPYTNEVTELMLPLLKFFLSDEVRSSAAEIMPFLLKSSKQFEYPRAPVLLYERIFKALVEAIEEEPYESQICDFMQSLGDCIKVIGTQHQLTQEYLKTICDLLIARFEMVLESQEQNVKTRLSEDYDEDEDGEGLEESEEETELLLSKIVHVMHSLLMVYHDEVFPVFQQIASDELMGQLFQPGSPDYNLEYALCFYDDMIEACSPQNSMQYFDRFAPKLLEGLRHTKNEIRQAAAYGLGVISMNKATNAVPQYNQLLRELTPVLMEVVMLSHQHVDSYNRDEDSNMATENGISALTKIFKNAPECLPNHDDLSGFLSNWVRWLPIYDDVEETPHVYGLLCDLIESENLAVLGQDNANLPHILRSIAFCLEKKGLKDSNTLERCIRIVKMLQQSNNEIFTACISSMTTEEQIALKKAMENSVSSH